MSPRILAGVREKIGSTYLESCEKFPKEWESDIMEKTQSLKFLGSEWDVSKIVLKSLW